MNENKYTEVCWARVGDISYPIKYLYEKGKFSYPNKVLNTETNQLEIIYENTFFLDKKEAWESLKKLSLGFIESSGRLVKQRKEELLKAQKKAGNYCEFYNDVIRNYKNDKDLN